MGASGATFNAKADFEARLAVAHQKPCQISETIADSFSGGKHVGNCLKHVLAKLSGKPYAQISKIYANNDTPLTVWNICVREFNFMNINRLAGITLMFRFSISLSLN